MSKESRAEWKLKNPDKGAEYQRKYRAKDTGMSLFRTARQRARTKEIPFDIEFTDLVFPTHCPILGIELKTYSGNEECKPGGRDDSFSIDRIIPSLGYTKGNVQVISHKANAMKSNASKEELLAFANWILREYK